MYLPLQQCLQHRLPRVVGRHAEMQHAGEFFRPVLVRSVINQNLSPVQILVVRQNQPFVQTAIFFFSKMLVDPMQLVVAGRRVAPRGGGEDINIVPRRQSGEGVHSTGHRLHTGENAGHLVKVGVILKSLQRGKSLNATFKIYQGAVHINVQNRLFGLGRGRFFHCHGVEVAEGLTHRLAQHFAIQMMVAALYPESVGGGDATVDARIAIAAHKEVVVLQQFVILGKNSEQILRGIFTMNLIDIGFHSPAHGELFLRERSDIAQHFRGKTAGIDKHLVDDTAGVDGIFDKEVVYAAERRRYHSINLFRIDQRAKFITGGEYVEQVEGLQHPAMLREKFLEGVARVGVFIAAIAMKVQYGSVFFHIENVGDS